jgi:creatinine amidohydrolase/Fe(II)-dependent formamide hydrolase-like protein
MTTVSKTIENKTFLNMVQWIVLSSKIIIYIEFLFVGYSEYHSGFQGTLSLKPETMEQVLFECIEFLINAWQSVTK